jgi:hypothetical protein
VPNEFNIISEAFRRFDATTAVIMAIIGFNKALTVAPTWLGNVRRKVFIGYPERHKSNDTAT